MRILLIQPPFWAVNSPSLGLSYLRAALREAGMVAEIHYANLDFANLVGRDLYRGITSQVPVDLLFGDLLFGPALHGVRMTSGELTDLTKAILSRDSVNRSIPEALIAAYESLTTQAIRFVEAFEERRSWRSYDLVGFTTTFSLVPALAMAQAIRRTGDSPPLVFGGCHCEGSLGEALLRHFPWIDYAVRGDGERSLVALVQSLEAGQPSFQDIDGLLWREGRSIVGAKAARANQEDLDGLPVPEFGDWFGALKALGWGITSELRLPLETSRGCWYGQRHPCTFCGLNGAGMMFRAKGSARILKEYEALLEYEVPVINAVDSVLDPRFFKDVIPRIEAMPNKATMFFEVRATHSLEQLKSLQRAGIRLLQPGIESLDSRLLGLMNKGTTAFQNVRMLRWTAELAIPVSWNLLYGFPGETSEDYWRMAGLLPSIEHLLPPVTDCNRVHVDRFSPLFEKHRALIQPIVPYGLALGLPPDSAEELAYHFEFASADFMKPDTGSAIEALRIQVSAWQQAVGKSVFASLQREGRYWLYDSRQSQPAEEVWMDPVESQAMRLLEDGCSRDRLHTHLGESHGCVDELLARFVSRRWAAELDGKFLGLAVRMDELIPVSIPESLLGSVIETLYGHRLVTMRKAVTE